MAIVLVPRRFFCRGQRRGNDWSYTSLPVATFVWRFIFFGSHPVEQAETIEAFYSGYQSINLRLQSDRDFGKSLEGEDAL